MATLLLTPPPSYAMDSSVTDTQTSPSAVSERTRKPLRVVIPNIKSRKKTEHADTVTSSASAHRTARQIIKNTPKQDTPAPLSRVIYETVQEVWYNGVTLLQRGGEFITQAMFKPNIAFASLPSQWMLNQPANAMPSQEMMVEPPAMPASVPAPMQQPATSTIAQPLSPPADPIQPVAPTQFAMQQEEVNDVANIATLQPAAGQEAAPVELLVAQNTSAHQHMDLSSGNVETQVTVDYSEPAPTLSTQSKKIIENIKPIEPKKIPAPIPKVNIQHHRKIDAILNKATSAPANDLGIKTKENNAPKLDVSYELERAYNALIAGRSDDAIRIYEDILTSDPRNSEALFGLASTYHRVGQLDIARSLYGKLLEVAPTHRDGLNNFLVLLSEEAPEESLLQMQRLEDLNPTFSPIPAQMAIIYQKLGHHQQAIDKMYRALSLSPESMTYRYNLAIMLDRNGQYAQAGKLYAQVIQAHQKGEIIPGDARKIQQRLTFIRSNSPR